MRALAGVVATAVDATGIPGAASSGQPQGIIGSGIGRVTGTSLALGGILELQAGVGEALDPGSVFVTTGAIASLLAAQHKETNTSSCLWEGLLSEGTLTGVRAFSSAQMPTGNLLFGDFVQVIVASWSVLTIAVNPFAGFTAGIIGVRAFWCATSRSVSRLPSRSRSRLREHWGDLCRAPTDEPYSRSRKRSAASRASERPNVRGNDAASSDDGPHGTRDAPVRPRIPTRSSRRQAPVQSASVSTCDSFLRIRMSISNASKVRSQHLASSNIL